MGLSPSTGRARDAKPETRGRNYFISEASSIIGPSDEAGSSKRFEVLGDALEGRASSNRKDASMEALLSTHPMIEIMFRH